MHKIFLQIQNFTTHSQTYIYEEFFFYLFYIFKIISQAQNIYDYIIFYSSLTLYLLYVYKIHCIICSCLLLILNAQQYIPMTQLLFLMWSKSSMKLMTMDFLVVQIVYMKKEKKKETNSRVFVLYSQTRFD